ncbi:hypothetical protein BIW11_01321 [Tropilaelaps mercedesae]|uniref:Cadherin domain-containing protein n=1 Tax=Tropilaelaps mercedesae TaxID=418985 RepID=A0A1V9XG58_9ACAR|nr:hypothetical protein BIW11_01321 [Tropilaelaps mercedesae]
MMLSKTREVESSQDYPALETTTEFAVAVVSEENHAPQFVAGSRMLGQIAEQSPLNSAVKWTPGYSNKVFDKDSGINSTFKLELEDDALQAFEVVPHHVIRETEFALVVRDPSKLCYDSHEDPHFTMKVIATETESTVPLSAQIEVVVEIIDVNDHFPQFEQDTYAAHVREDALPGTHVITATDVDSGLYGKVRYTALLGPMASSFSLNSQTGSIMLVSSSGLDREKVAEYLLAVEARDEDGNGHKALTQLRIVVDDANDNLPIFLQPRYDAVLNAEKSNFTQPLIVKAVDADSPGPNSNVTYEIIAGNLEDKFVIEQQQGLITLKEYLARNLAVVIPRSSFEVHSQRSRYEKGLSDLFGAQVSILNVGVYNDSARHASVVEAQATYDQRRIDLNEALWFFKILAEQLFTPQPAKPGDEVKPGGVQERPGSNNEREAAQEKDNIEGHRKDPTTGDRTGGQNGGVDVATERTREREKEVSSSTDGRNLVHKPPEVMHTGIDERVLWILVVCFLLVILVLLICLLCCCWRNFFRTNSTESNSMSNAKHHTNFGLPPQPPQHLVHDQSYMSGNTLPRSTLNRSDQRSINRGSEYRGAQLFEETDDDRAAEDSYNRHRYITKEFRRQRGQRKGQARGADGADVRRVGSYVLIKKILPDGRFRDREDSLSDLASSLTHSNQGSFLPRRRQRRVRPSDDRRNSIEDDTAYEERKTGPKKTEILYIKTPPAPTKGDEANSLDSFDAALAGVNADLRSVDDSPVTSTPIKPVLPNPGVHKNETVNISTANLTSNSNNNDKMKRTGNPDDDAITTRDSSVIAHSEITDLVTTDKMTSISAASESTRGFRFSRSAVELPFITGRRTELSEDDSDSGIGGGPVMTLRNPYFKKKSIFTITYDDVRRTEPLRTAYRDSP